MASVSLWGWSTPDSRHRVLVFAPDSCNTLLPVVESTACVVLVPPDTAPSAMPLTERSKNFAISTPATGIRALEIVVRHERSTELHRLRKLNQWFEGECLRNFHRSAYAQRRFEMLRDAVVPRSFQDQVSIWKNADGVHVMHSDSDVIGIL